LLGGLAGLVAGGFVGFWAMVLVIIFASASFWACSIPVVLEEYLRRFSPAASDFGLRADGRWP
jgi:hypothetical protein